jgi:hypothetical protein
MGAWIPLWRKTLHGPWTHLVKGKWDFCEKFPTWALDQRYQEKIEGPGNPAWALEKLPSIYSISIFILFGWII